MKIKKNIKTRENKYKNTSNRMYSERVVKSISQLDHNTNKFDRGKVESIRNRLKREATKVLEIAH